MESEVDCKTSKTSSVIFKMGKYTFEYPKSHAKKKPIHKEAIKTIKMQANDTLDISWGKYKRYKWESVLKHVRECEVQQISACKFYNMVDGNSDKNILITLSRISFYNLSNLNLVNNYITSVKLLTKYHLPALKTLLLNDNPIKQMGVERCDFCLETYWLERQLKHLFRKYNFKTIKECLGQTCLFKLKSDEIKDVSIESMGRIHQPQLILKIHEKFPNLQNLFYIQPEDLFESDTEFVVYLSDDEEENDNEIVQFQQILMNQLDVPQPPPLHFVEGEKEENWINGINAVQQGENVHKQVLEQKEGEIDQDDEQADDEEDSNQKEECSDEMEEGQCQESSYESSSCWDSVQEDENDQQQPQIETQSMI